MKISTEDGKKIKINEDGQSIIQKSSYYEGGYLNSLEILEDLWANLKFLDNTHRIKKSIKYYEDLSPEIFPVLMVDGIFDRVWKSMGMPFFSKNFQKKTKLYRKIIEFYSELI